MKRTATVSGLFVLIFVLTGGLAFGQHWQHDGNQGEYHTMAVQSATINGAAVEADDEIAVFTPGGDLGGTVVVTIDQDHPPFTFSAWGATGVPFNEAGFANGDALTFKIWDNSASEELVAVSSPTGLTWAGDDFGGDPLFFSLIVGPEIDVSDESHAYGDVNLNTSVEWTFTIENIGSEALQVSSVTSNLGVYTTNFDNNNGVGIAAGSSHDVIVTFTPTAEQAYNGTLTIASNDADEAEVTVSVTGTGVTEGEPDITVSTANHAFGEVNIGDNSSFALTITNDGAAELNVSSITSNLGVYTTNFDNNNGVVVGAGNSIEVSVTFTPTAAQAYNGILTIASDDPDEAEVTVSLSGTGVVGPHFEYTATNISHNLIINEALLDGSSLVADDEIGVFTPGDVCAGAVILEEQQGDAPLNVNAVDLPAGLTAYGAEGQVAGFADGDAFVFKYWDVSAEAEYVATVIFESGPEDWEADGFTTISLNGQSVAAPEIEIANDDLTHDFGELLKNTTDTWSFDIQNIGGENLTITSITSNLGVYTTDVENNTVIQPDASLTVTVTFAPTDAQTYNDTLRVNSDDEDEGEIEITVTGTGVEPTITGVGHLDTPGSARGINVSGDYAYVADGSSGLRIADISDPANPDEVGVFDTPGNAVELYVNGNYAYVADEGQGLRIVDISAPANPSGAGSHPAESYTYDVVVQDGYAYLADWVYGLRVIDVTDPANPDEVGFLRTAGNAVGINLVGETIYLVTYGSGLRVIDVSDPTNPDEIGSYDTPGNAMALTVIGNQAFVADYSGGLVLLNISDPANISAAGTFDTPDRARAVWVVGDYAYVADMNTGLLALNISNPADIEQVAVFDTDYQVNDVQIVGDRGFITDAAGGLRIVGVDDFPMPNLANDPAAVAFSDLDIRADASQNRVTITNNGDAQLTIDAFVYGDGFSTTFGNPVTLQANGTTDITVSFDPDAAQDYTGTLRVFSNDDDVQVAEIALTGTGIRGAEIQTVADLAFGEVEVNQQGEATLTIENIGGAELTIDNIVSDNDIFTVEFERQTPQNDWEFTETNQSMNFIVTNATIDGNQLVTDDYIGAFTEGGICAGYTQVTVDGFDVGVTGYGDDPNTGVVEGFGNGDAVTWRVWDTDVGEEYTATANYASGEGVFTADGFATLSLVANMNGQEAPLLVNVNDPIAPGESMDVFVYFNPTAVQDYEGTLTITSDDAFNEEVTVNVTGTGIDLPPDITLDPTTLNFGSLYAGRQSSDLTFTITNDGARDLTVESIAVVGDGFTINNNGDFTLEADSSQTVTVTFEPDTAGDYNGTVTVTSDDPDEGEATVTLTGTGANYPIVRLDPEAFDFGDVVHGQSSEQTLTVHNDGEEPLNITNISSDSAAFTVNFDANQEVRQFDWSFTETQANMSLLVNDATIEGDQLVDSDYIGVFTANGVCAGYTQIGGDANFNDGVGVTAFQDDNGTEAEDGFAVGATINYRLWDTDAGREFTATPNYAQGNGQFQAGELYVLTLASNDEINAGGDNVVAAGDSTEFTVTFSPTAVQEYNGTLTVESDDPFNGEETATLTGNGVNTPADIAVDPTSLDFETLYATQEMRDLTFSITIEG